MSSIISLIGKKLTNSLHKNYAQMTVLDLTKITIEKD